MCVCVYACVCRLQKYSCFGLKDLGASRGKPCSETAVTCVSLTKQQGGSAQGLEGITTCYPCR